MQKTYQVNRLIAPIPSSSPPTIKTWTQSALAKQWRDRTGWGVSHEGVDVDLCYVTDAWLSVSNHDVPGSKGSLHSLPLAQYILRAFNIQSPYEMSTVQSILTAGAPFVVLWRIWIMIAITEKSLWLWVRAVSVYVRAKEWLSFCLSGFGITVNSSDHTLRLWTVWNVSWFW